jgi:hypothetical protein
VGFPAFLPPALAVLRKQQHGRFSTEPAMLPWRYCFYFASYFSSFNFT